MHRFVPAHAQKKTTWVRNSDRDRVPFGYTKASLGDLIHGSLIDALKNSNLPIPTSPVAPCPTGGNPSVLGFWSAILPSLSSSKCVSETRTTMCVWRLLRRLVNSSSSSTCFHASTPPSFRNTPLWSDSAQSRIQCCTFTYVIYNGIQSRVENSAESLISHSYKSTCDMHD